MYPGLIGCSFYEGSLGLCLAIKRYFAFATKYDQDSSLVTWSRRFLVIESQCIAQLELALRQSRHDLPNPGVSGLAGALVALEQLMSTSNPNNEYSYLCRDLQELYGQISMRLIKDIVNSSRNSISLDYLNGLSGTLNILARLLPDLVNENLLSMMPYIQLILDQVNVGFRDDNKSDEIHEVLNLLNIAHGLGGRILAMTRLITVAKGQPCIVAYKEHIAVSAQLFAAKCEQLMKTFLASNDRKYFPLQWCNGLIGVMLVSECISHQEIAFSHDRTVFQECLEVIMNSISDLRKYYPAHLCCGISGILLSMSLLKDLDYRLDSELLKDEMLWVMQSCLEGSASFLNSRVAGQFQPGLYSGISGVAFAGIEIFDGRRMSPYVLT